MKIIQFRHRPQDAAATRIARDNLVHQLRAVERELRFAIFLTSPKTQRLQDDRHRLMKAIEQL